MFYITNIDQTIIREICDEKLIADNSRSSRNDPEAYKITQKKRSHSRLILEYTGIEQFLDGW